MTDFLKRNNYSLQFYEGSGGLWDLKILCVSIRTTAPDLDMKMYIMH